MNLLNKDHPKYEPEKWNSNEYVQKTHNCYAYALNVILDENPEICKKYMEITKDTNCHSLKPQIGRRSGYLDEYKLIKLTCETAIKRLKSDVPCVKKLKKNQECPDGYYKIALACKTNTHDYHFYRQDNTGLWSHKVGWRKATNKDYDGRLIRDPETANRGIYDIFCGYFMIPNSNSCKENISPKTKKYKNNKSGAEIIKELIKLNTK